MTREATGALETRPVQVGNYKFTGKILGKGTFATVEEAIHIHLRVKVSVKTLNLHKCNAYVLKHLKREAAILNQLNHPHILRLFETLRFGNTFCLVTEVVNGGDLCTLLQRHRGEGLSERCTRRLGRQIAAALEYLHRRGVVHRDIKLENIMLDSRKENIKLVDFGLSNHWSADSPLKTMCGSPEYSAPELFVPGTKYGPEVDMWAFGVVLYAMAAGQLPFPGACVLMRDQDKKQVFVQMINKGLSDAHIRRIKDYHPEFSKLLRGLVNPLWQQRLSVEGVTQDPWMSNRHRWVTERYETLDAYDIGKVFQKVCSQLRVTGNVLREELKAAPCGEVAGYYNIALFQRARLNTTEAWSCPVKSSTRTTTSSSRKVSTEQNFYKNVQDNRVLVIGEALRVNGNEFIRRKTPLQHNFQTTVISSVSHNSNKSWSSSRSGTPDFKGGGDCTMTTVPQIGPFKGKKVDSPYLTPNSQSRPSGNINNKNMKFKEKNAFFARQILPSKLRLKTPTSKFNVNQFQEQGKS